MSDYDGSDYDDGNDSGDEQFVTRFFGDDANIPSKSFPGGEYEQFDIIS